MKTSSSILIIDDNPDDVFFARRAILELRTDCIVEVASDGIQALERLRSANPPTLVLLDLNMPGTDGIDILKFMRNREQTRYTPAIVLSSSTMEEDNKASYDAGANGYLNKMYDLAEFTKSLKSILDYWIDQDISLAR